MGEKMRHAILGAGGVGGLIGAALARSGESVTLVLRAEALTNYPGYRWRAHLGRLAFRSSVHPR
jgi:ketopantoate reductase